MSHAKLLDRLVDMAKEIIEGTWSPEHVDPHNLEMALDTWVDGDGGCGTTACIIGHAMLDGRFTEELGPPEHSHPDNYIDILAEEEDYPESGLLIDLYLFMPSQYPGHYLMTRNQILKEFITRVEVLRENGTKGLEHRIYEQEKEHLYERSG